MPLFHLIRRNKNKVGPFCLGLGKATNSARTLSQCFNTVQRISRIPSGKITSEIMTSNYDFYDKWWLSYLPPKYNEILAKAGTPMNFRSYREIYYKIYRGLYIEGGTQRVSLNYTTDKVILMVSAKALDINGVLDSRYWQWVAMDDSRFGVAAEAKDVEWFEVWQSIESTILSPKTRYSVSFVLKIVKQIVKSCSSPFEFSLKSNGVASEVSYIHLDDMQKSPENGKKKTETRNSDQRGWTEFVLGEFTTEENGEMEIEVCMKNTDRASRKKGITIDGVQITPIN